MNTKTITSKLSAILICITLCSGAVVAQVRQSIQVKDYETGQPMAGVEVKCGGQKQTTNAKGMAVFTFAGKAYGDFVELDITLRKTDYISIGKDWKSRQLPSNVLTKEPLVLNMVKAGRYYAERDRLFDSLFLFRYRDTYRTLLEQAAAETAEDPDEANGWSNAFVHQNMYNEAWKTLYEIANEINPLAMHSIDSSLRKSCEHALWNGDLQGSLALARAQIADNDFSDQNLQRIMYYLELWEAAEDTTPTSPYYKILFDHGFSKNTYTVIGYMNCLLKEEKKEASEAFRAYAKDSCKDLYMNLIVSRPHTMDLFNESPEAGVAEALAKVRIEEQYFPNYKSMICHYRRTAAYYLLESGDTLQANRQLDTALETLLQTDRNNYVTETDYLLKITDELNNLVAFPEGIDSALAQRIMEKHLWATSEIYRLHPSLFSRLLYFYAIKNSLKQYDSATLARIRTMEGLLPELQRVMPEIMYPEQLRIKELLLQGSLQLHASKEEITRCFNDYKAALPPCEPWHPYLYAYGLNTNYAIKARCYSTGNTFLIQPLDAYTQELLEKKARILHEDSLVVKGTFFNHEAEQMYRDELYTQSLSTYDKAIRYYQRQLPTNDSAYLEILNAWLQKGDAYMQLEQLPEAFACYQQVLDHEKRMPAHLKVPYTINKGVAYHFQGDLFTMQQDYKKAMKYYGYSEKAFKQAEKAGDTTFYARWGEMHYNKALTYYRSGQEKQCMEEMQRAESLYDSYPLQEPSKKYENLKNILTEHYEENDQYAKLLKSLTFYFNYCDSMKYYSVERYNEYVRTAIRLANLWGNYNVVTAQQRYLKTAKEGLDFLQDYGVEKDVRYAQILFTLGKNYRLLDSTEQALTCLRQCLELNEQLLAESDPQQCIFNNLNTKSQIVKCINAIPDSVRTSQQRDEVLALQKEIVAKLSTMDTTPALRRNLAYHHRQLGVVYINMEWYQMALSQLDSSIAISLPMWQSGDRAETEDEIIRSHYISAVVNYYMMEERDSKAADEHIDQCLAFCEKAVSPEEIIDVYYNAVNMKLEMLSDPFATKDEEALKKYRKLKASLEKEMK